MSKFIGIAIGGLEIGTGLFLEFVTFGASTPLTMFLISSGAGMVMSGIGTLLSKGPVSGTSTLLRNPIAPWNVVYGRAKLGGTLVHVNEFGDDNKYLDMVSVLACHPSKSVDALLLDGVRVRLDANGCSFTPEQQTVTLSSLTRSKGVVLATLSSGITDLQTGDSLVIQNVPDDTFNGRFAVTVVPSTNTFTYICGGSETTVSGGEAITTWPDYKAKIHMEVLLGNHTETFPGMINGTPYDGDPSNPVRNDNNPWTADHRLLGKTSVFLRFHYNDDIFANGLPTISFHMSGKNGIFDPRIDTDPTPDEPNILARPSTTLNGWGNNAHVGPYELGQDQATNWGLNDDTTFSYTNPNAAVDTDLTTAATCIFQQTHKYAGCIWSFGTLPSGSVYLNVRSEVPATSSGRTVTRRSAGIWYSLDGGANWVNLYNTNSYRQQWANVRFDVVAPTTPSPLPNVLQRPTTMLNGWGNNAHDGPYELGHSQQTNWGPNDDTTFPYTNPDSALDGDLNSSTSSFLQHTHKYAGCIWKFAALSPSQIGALAGADIFVNIRSEVPLNTSGAVVTLRSAGIWYPLDGGASWTALYNSTNHPRQWQHLTLSSVSQNMSQVQIMAFNDAHDDMIHNVYDINVADGIFFDPIVTSSSQVQVMAFTDSHDDMVHNVYDINIADGPFIDQDSSNGAGYTENAALCIADYLSNTTYGYKAPYDTEIPLSQLISAANICDELVPLAAGGSEPRYTCNGTFPLTMKRGEVLQNLLTSCGGRLVYSQGQFVIHPAAWAGTSFTLPLPPTTEVDLPTKPIASARIGILTSHFPNPALGCFAFAVSGTIALIGGTTPFLADQSEWTLRTDFSFPFGSDDIEHILDGTQAVLFENTQSLFQDAGPPADEFRIYDVWIDVTYVDGTTGMLRPSQAEVTVNTTHDLITNPQNAVDGNPSTYAAIQTKETRPLATASVLRVSSFGKTHSIVPDIGMGPFRWREKVGIRDLYNGVKGTYISPANNWQSADIPPYAQDQLHGYSSGSPLFSFGDANLSEDGGDRRWLDIQLPFTISSATAQRLCKIELLRRRQQGTGTFAFNMSVYKGTPLDVVQMTLPILQWTNKLLEIGTPRFTINQDQVDGNDVTLLGTEIDVQETDPSIYSWSASEELTAQGNQYPSTSGTSGGNSTSPPLVTYTNYQNTPVVSLSQPDTTHIALAAVIVTFPNRSVSYNARSLDITAPTVPTWYYVTIADPNFSGDVNVPDSSIVPLSAFAELTTNKVGVNGFIYMGAILCTPTAAGTYTSLPGGWPTPQGFIVGT